MRPSTTVLDFSLGDHFMREDFEAKTIPLALAKITGTAPLKEVSLIRNNQVIYQVSPNQRTAEIRYPDMQPHPRRST